jgi:MoaA/NifB/PqqE/SkfB family radical SAM enzyme
LLANRLISWMLVSVDAARAETYNKIRGGKYEVVIEGIKKLKAIKDKQFNDWQLKIGFTFMPSNMYEVLQFVDLANSLGVECEFSPVFGAWHSESFSYSSQSEIIAAKQIISDLENYLEKKNLGKIKAQRLRIAMQMI